MKGKMSIQSDHSNISAALGLELHLAAKDLGKRLRETPEFQEYVQAAWVFNGDAEIQELSAKLHSRRTALQQAVRDKAIHAAELERLEQEMEASPVYQAYRQGESKVWALFQSVDRLISQTAGVEFSVNAQRRRGCCG
jgi:cell fate (sporulation/competence/biofilm development) regulator YlbF (YheA/YmcA/DUF963 family)